jgi:hypothetical protein
MRVKFCIRCYCKKKSKLFFQGGMLACYIIWSLSNLIQFYVYHNWICMNLFKWISIICKVIVLKMCKHFCAKLCVLNKHWLFVGYHVVMNSLLIKINLQPDFGFFIPRTIASTTCIFWMLITGQLIRSSGFSFGHISYSRQIFSPNF